MGGWGDIHAGITLWQEGRRPGNDDGGSSLARGVPQLPTIPIDPDDVPIDSIGLSRAAVEHALRGGITDLSKVNEGITFDLSSKGGMPHAHVQHFADHLRRVAAAPHPVKLIHLIQRWQRN